MQLAPGDPAPTFMAVTRTNPRYVFDTAAGRYLLLALVGRGDEAFADTVDQLMQRHAALLTAEALAGFAMWSHTDHWSRHEDRLPGSRWMLDPSGAARTACGLGDDTAWSGWILVDPGFRVLGVLPADQTSQLDRILPNLPLPVAHAGVELFAPVLVIPRVFERELCQALKDAHDADGGEASGFMRQVEGKTVEVRDPNHKIRRDLLLPTGMLRDAVRTRIQRRLIPQIAKTFQFAVTRMERDLVACYDAEDQGFFRVHRDNTTKGTAHRRFAVTINLNAEDYEGGDLRFPEFGPRTYRAPTGGAVVFSCSLLHEALPVTKGKRYAFLPFLYDETAARVREENAAHVEIEGYSYTA